MLYLSSIFDRSMMPVIDGADMAIAAQKREGRGGVDEREASRVRTPLGAPVTGWRGCVAGLIVFLELEA
jgi:hypothetical protein